MNTPFQWTKQVASHFGGTRNGMVMSWPKGIKAHGEIRTQFHHVIDIVPTILEAAQLPQPAVVNGVTQHPIEGISMVYTFDDAKAAGSQEDPVFRDLRQFGALSRRLVRIDHADRLPWSGVGNDMDVLTTKWELYNIDKDFSQADDLAQQMPEKLREMQVRFYAEAAKYNVLPIQTSAAERFGEGIRPSLTGDRKSFTYTAGLKRIPEGASPNIKNRSWTAHRRCRPQGRRVRGHRHPGRPVWRLGAVLREGQAGVQLHLRGWLELPDRRQGRGAGREAYRRDGFRL